MITELKNKENFIINAFLLLNKTLASIQKLRNTGIEILTDLFNSLSEQDLLQRKLDGFKEQNSLDSRSIASKSKLVYSRALSNVKIYQAQKISQFQQEFLKRQKQLAQSIEKIYKSIQQLRLFEKKLTQSNLDNLKPKQRSYLTIFLELYEIVSMIVNQVKQQTDLITKKYLQMSIEIWKSNRNDNTSVCEKSKKLLLHISFETMIQDEVVQEWQNKLSGLDKARRIL